MPATTIEHAARLKLLFLGALTTLLVLIYVPGLNGPFVFDDFQNFIHNKNTYLGELTWAGIWEVMNSWSGKHLPNRPLSRLTLGLNYFFSGGGYSAAHMKATNIAIHVINALILFFVANNLFRARVAGLNSSSPGNDERMLAFKLAMLATAIWALHPIQLTSVLYVVQRMASLSATFVLLGLLCYTIGRARLAEHPLHGVLIMLFGMGGCVVIGFFNKENAILLPFFALVCEVFFYRRDDLSGVAKKGLKVVFALSVVMPLVLLVVMSPKVAAYLDAGYAWRPFTLSERFLTQGRILLMYVGIYLAPTIDAFTLWHDDYQLSTSLFSPWTTWVSWLTIALAVVAGLCAIAKRWMWAFAVLFFCTGHLLESTVVPLELVFEHRNYMPGVGFCLAAAWYLVRAGQWLRMSQLGQRAIVVALVFTLAFVTFNRARIWGDERILAQHVVKFNPDSYRAHAFHAKTLARYSAPVQEIFSSLQRASNTQAEVIFPLVRMRRLLAALLYQLEVQGLKSVEVDAPPVDYNSPAKINIEYTRQLASLIDQEIRRRIVGSVLHGETIAELDQTRQCLFRNLDLCFGLQREAKIWTKLALEKARTNTNGRARLVFIDAGLSAREGDMQRALERVREAQAIKPDKVDPGMRQQEAIYLAHLGRMDEARSLLSALEKENRNNPSMIESVKDTREIVTGIELQPAPKRQ